MRKDEVSNEKKKLGARGAVLPEIQLKLMSSIEESRWASYIMDLHLRCEAMSQRNSFYINDASNAVENAVETIYCCESCGDKA